MSEMSQLSTFIVILLIGAAMFFLAPVLYEEQFKVKVYRVFFVFVSIVFSFGIFLSN